MKKVVAIVGPTAVGKSALGLSLAQKLNGEIISGDSMQIYRGLDIGTAKDSPEELALVPHHLVNIADVTERYTVKDFQENAFQRIDEITSRGKTPFIVGGTGFYLNALLKNLHLGGDEHTDEQLREQLLQVEQSEGIIKLQHMLKDLDPIAYQRIDINNSRRVIRAIEVFKSSGRSIVDQSNGLTDNQYCLIGLTDDRDKLYDRINTRVDKMVQNGLIDEARPVFDQQEQIPQAKNGIGYKELFPYFEGTASLDDCVAQIKTNSRRFAKRQLTYFRNQMSVDWLNISDDQNFQNKAFKKVQEFINE